MQRTVQLHFLKFDIRATDVDLGDWIDRLYADNDVRTRFPGREATLRLVIERLEHEGVRTPEHAIFAETNLCGAACYFADGRFYASRDDELRHRLQFDVDTGVVHAQVGGLYLQSGQHIVTDLIRPILQSFLLPFFGLKSLHGAVVHKDGQTTFLDGPGGAGKTTTAMMLANAGYDLLSDDGPLFTMSDGETYVLSSLDFAHVTDRTLQLFPHLAPWLVGGKDTRGKYAVSLRRWQRPGSAGPFTVTRYVRLNRRGIARPRVTRLDRQELFRHLVDGSMVVFRKAPFRNVPDVFKTYSQEMLNLITQLVRTTDVYELEFADHHLPEIPALLESMR